MPEGLAAARKLDFGTPAMFDFEGSVLWASGDVKFEKPCGVFRGTRLKL